MAHNHLCVGSSPTLAKVIAGSSSVQDISRFGENGGSNPSPATKLWDSLSLVVIKDTAGKYHPTKSQGVILLLVTMLPVIGDRNWHKCQKMLPHFKTYRRNMGMNPARIRHESGMIYG